MTNAINKTELSRLWDHEYEQAGIPSSVRQSPSATVVEFIDFLPKNLTLSGVALDVGCGSGRNSIYLAEKGFKIHCMDFAESQVSELQRKALDRSLPINPILHDVTTPWPFEDQTFDILIDAFCFKHQIDEEDIKTYVDEAFRVLRKSGLAMISFATKADGYYSQFPCDNQFGTGTIIIDGGNGIASRLYDIDELVASFAPMRSVKSIIKPGRNLMHGRLYDRESAVVYLEK